MNIPLSKLLFDYLLTRRIQITFNLSSTMDIKSFLFHRLFWASVANVRDNLSPDAEKYFPPKFSLQYIENYWLLSLESYMQNGILTDIDTSGSLSIILKYDMEAQKIINFLIDENIKFNVENVHIYL